MKQLRIRSALPTTWDSRPTLMRFGSVVAGTTEPRHFGPIGRSMTGLEASDTFTRVKGPKQMKSPGSGSHGRKAGGDER